MDNPEELLHSLDEFAKLKPKNIPRELEDYLMYVARTGDPVYQWPVVKCLFREKLLNVITEFYETTPTLDLTPSPNVDPFNYENMKTVLLERLEAFSNAPFTVQRLCELLTTPRKEYNRPDKFMRAIEKNILVVSTREPGSACRPDSALSEPIQNGVSEPPDTPPSQPISSDENNVAKTLHEESPKESVENHIVVQATSSQDLNHIDSEQAGPSPKVNDVLEERKEEEISEAIATESKETSENVVASTSVTDIDIKDVPVASAANVVLEVHPADSISHPEESGLLNQPLSDSPLVSEKVEDVTASSSSPESTSVRDAGEETFSGSVLSEKNESVSETENSETKEAACDRLAVEDQSTLEPVLEVLTEDASHSLRDKVDVEENGTCAAVDEVPNISPVKEEQAVDSTALDSGESKDAPSTENASSSQPESDVENLSSEGKPESNKEVTSKILDSSEATPAHKKVETEAKQVVSSGKSDEDASISSTEATDEEAMEVDESSNQPSEAADSEAMDVAVEDEPMEVCEENPVGEVAASSQEIGQ